MQRNREIRADEAELRDERTTYPEADVAGAPRGAVERAPLAAAAALSVLACGAAFLAYAMTRPTLPAAPIVSEIEISRPVEPVPQSVISPSLVEPAAEAAAALVEPRNLASDADEIITPDETAAAEFAPRVKPAAGRTSISEPAANAASAVLTLASAWTASDADRPPPFFFESDAPSFNGAFPEKRAKLDGDIASAPKDLRVSLTKGETFVDALQRAGVRAEDRNAAAYAFGKHYDLRRLRPGQEFRLAIAEPYRTLFQAMSERSPPPAYLLSLEFRVDAENRISLSRLREGGFAAKEVAAPLTTRIASINGRIDGSLYLSAKRLGAPDEIIAGLAQMFAYDVDFQREIFGGDEFEALFEVNYDEAGKMVGGGDILFGRLKWRGRQKEKGYYRFETADGGGKGDYFDTDGESARRLLMKTPIDGARLSSGFGTRKHPILGYQKAHKGVDFAASRGTPIMAAGDGVIERAGPYGSFGNYVRIRHAQGYKTAYAHMNSIKKGVRTGVRVRQGDIIGYVGTTGRSTGPHLHYEVHLKDTPVNPQSLKIATGYELGGKELARFKEARDRINGMRPPQMEAQPPTPVLAQEERTDPAP